MSRRTENRFNTLMNRFRAFAVAARRNPAADTEEVIGDLVNIATIALHCLQNGSREQAERAMNVFEGELNAHRA